MRRLVQLTTLLFGMCAVSLRAAEPAAVEVIKPQRATMSRSFELPATIEAFEQADLLARVAGYIKEVKVDIGDRVKAGEVLAVIDQPETERDLAEARATLVARQAMLRASEAAVEQSKRANEIATRQLDRYRADLHLQEVTYKRREELFAGKAITDQDLDETRTKLEMTKADVAIAEAKIKGTEADVVSALAARDVAAAQVSVAEAQVAKIQTLLDYTRISSRFDGVITRRWIDPGALVAAGPGGRAMFNVQDLDKVRVAIDVPESDVQRVKIGTPAKVKVFGSDAAALDGKVTRTASSLNPATRTMRAEVHLPNGNGTLMHGMYARVTLTTDVHENALTVPPTVVLSEGNESVVYVIKNEQVVRMPVKLGLSDSAKVELATGVGEDALIVVNPRNVTAGMSAKAIKN